MWLMTKYGFYSIVKDDTQNNVYKVRAREEKDLLNLKKNIGCLKNSSIHFDIYSDYSFRIFVGQKKLEKIISFLQRSIDYPNFKNEIAKGDQKSKLSAYSEIWSCLYNFQLQLPFIRKKREQNLRNRFEILGARRGTESKIS